MARQVILEISWLRPLKLIGLANILCGIIAFILSMVLKSWVVSDTNDRSDFYMSLWTKCTRSTQDYNNGTVVVEDEDETKFICNDATGLGGYVTIVQALIVIPFIIAIICFVVGCIAYCKREWRYLFKIAGIMLIIAAIGVLIAVVLFPIMFLSNLPFYAFFWFWWGYGLAWAAMCFILTAGILFLISQDKKKLFHTEKTMTI